MTTEEIDALAQEANELRCKLNTRPEFICGHVICDSCARIKNRFCQHVICDSCAIELNNMNMEYENYIRRIWAIEDIIGGN